ncbi:MAG: GTPase HflX [Fervidobacterium sp.]|jgi:GTP-binding protein HflX
MNALEKALLVGIQSNFNKEAFESLNELEALCETLGLSVFEKIVQKREKPDTATYIGSGKLEKIKVYCQENGISLLVFDDEITPIQQRNIEKITNLKVLDRTQVILEIFAKHAQTKEGKLQVEMARLTYMLPRLRGKGRELSNPGGGIGTRGLGEKILELDKRKIRERINQLKKELEKLRINRQITRKARSESGYYVFSIAGYTNAGKSTLLSALSNEKDILISDKLFATLSPTVRKVKLPNGRYFLLSDTVGFIKKLPHTLIEAFHSTLEEITCSNVIILLVDICDPSYKEKIIASQNVLEQIGVIDKPIFLVFNKIDLVPNEHVEAIKYQYPSAVFISAKSKLGFDTLYKKIKEYIDQMDVSKRIIVPLDKIGNLMKYSEYLEWEIISQNGFEALVDMKGPESVVTKIADSLFQM